MLDLGAYLLAAAELVAIAAALVFGAIRVRAALMPQLAGAPARLAEAVLALSTLLVVSEALGLVGLFEEWALTVGLVGVGVAAGLLARRYAREAFIDAADVASPFGGRRLQIGIAIAATAIVFGHWLIPTAEALQEGMYGFDSQWYHLPFAARFAETGQLWDFHYTTPVLLSWFYPANAELLHAVGMEVTGRDVLSPLINLGWLALALLAAWCVGRRWGVGGFSVLGAFLVLDAGVLADQAGDARNDAMALALILAAAALLAQRPAAVGASALAAGMALGTRLTSLGPVAALTVGVIAVARHGRRLATAAAWIVPLLLTGGLWYLRNLVQVGSPLPQVMSLGPLDLPGPDQALGGRPSYSVAHYLTDFGVWADWFAPALRDAFGVLWPLALALAVLGAALAVLRGPGSVVRMLGVVAIVTAIVYVVTPVTASGPEGEPIGFGPNLRYLAPGLVLALALLPVAMTGYPARVRAAGAAALGVAALPLAFDLDRWTESDALGLVAFAGACVLAGALVLVEIERDRAGEVKALYRRRPIATGILVAALAAAVGAFGYLGQRSYLDERYRDTGQIDNPGLEAVFRWATQTRDERIATTTTRQYPLYGNELSNHVQHIGVERPEGGFVAAADCESWREAVDAGDYDYVVTALDRVEEGGPAEPPELAWTASSPNATEVLARGSAAVFALDGPLDPAACPADLEDGER